MITKTIISTGLWIVGGPMPLIALFSGGDSMVSMIERLQHGSGLLFADVEFFGFSALTGVILSLATLFAARKLSASGEQ